MKLQIVLVTRDAIDAALRQVYIAWGKNLRAARGTYWQQKDLAAVCGITPGALSNIEAGRRCPDDAVKYALAGALRREVADLFPWPDGIPPFPSLVKAMAS